MQMPQVQGKLYGVIGLGKTGIATIAALLENGADVVAWDDGGQKREELAASLAQARLIPPEGWNWQKLQALLLSPGVPLYYPKPHVAAMLAQEHHVPIMGDIALLQQANAQARYVGITGTNGKSTTTSLVGHVVAQSGKAHAVGGNLGTAVLSLPALGAAGIYVLELSSYQLDLCEAVRFQTAVWLNISPDHLDRHGDLAGYIAAKQRIFSHQQVGDVAIIGVDDAASKAVADHLKAVSHPARIIPISVTQALEDGVYVKDGVLYDGAFGHKPFDLRNIKTLQGAHNWQNAAAAYAACLAEGLPYKQVVAAIQTYAGLQHRMQWLGEHQGITYVNDSKATNADATEKALQTYDHIYWILGGVAKAGGIAPLYPYFPKIKKAYLIGEAADSFAQTLEGNVACEKSVTLEKAVVAAKQDASIAVARGEKAVILLSPACASFDQYPNFEVRGEAFIQLVQPYLQGAPAHV